MSDKFPMTLVGHQALKSELDHIRKVERPKNVDDIETARAHGDLRENAEYHAAKERQGILEVRLRELEVKLSHAEVINPKEMSGDRVVFGCHVTILYYDTDEEFTFQIVGDDESDFEQNKISFKSPIVRGIIGKKVGSECKIIAPKGVREVEILEVEFK